jgi:hypothetical protein
MAVRGSITYVGMDGVKPAALRQAIKDLLQQEVAGWHDNTLPRHFARGAKQRYGYKDRSPRYEKTKKRIHGHTRPLEFSGTLKQQILRKARISGTSKRATAAMDVPRYFFQYKPGQPDKAAEVTAVTPAEVTGMAVSLDRNLRIRINTTETKKTRV